MLSVNPPALLIPWPKNNCDHYCVNLVAFSTDNSIISWVLFVTRTSQYLSLSISSDIQSFGNQALTLVLWNYFAMFKQATAIPSGCIQTRKWCHIPEWYQSQWYTVCWVNRCVYNYAVLFLLTKLAQGPHKHFVEIPVIS